MATSKVFPDFSLSTTSPIGEVTFFRPDKETIKKTKSVAKEIFVEAFSTTYSEYHRSSRDPRSIEEWLRLKQGLTLRQWLEATFEEEHQEWLLGKMSVIYLKNGADCPIGWLSHAQVSESGDLYLSQCCLSEKWRRKGIPTSIFFHLLQQPQQIDQMFPGVKEVKLITRRINEAAHRLYTGVGMTKDETLDPSVYGDSYDDRYVGYRLALTKYLSV